MDNLPLEIIVEIFRALPTWADCARFGATCTLFLGLLRTLSPRLVKVNWSGLFKVYQNRQYYIEYYEFSRDWVGPECQISGNIYFGRFMRCGKYEMAYIHVGGGNFYSVKSTMYLSWVSLGGAKRLYYSGAENCLKIEHPHHTFSSSCTYPLVMNKFGRIVDSPEFDPILKKHIHFFFDFLKGIRCID